MGGGFRGGCVSRALQKGPGKDPHGLGLCLTWPRSIQGAESPSFLQLKLFETSQDSTCDGRRVSPLCSHLITSVKSPQTFSETEQQPAFPTENSNGLRLSFCQNTVAHLPVCSRCLRQFIVSHCLPAAAEMCSETDN